MVQSNDSDDSIQAIMFASQLLVPGWLLDGATERPFECHHVHPWVGSTSSVQGRSSILRAEIHWLHCASPQDWGIRLGFQCHLLECSARFASFGGKGPVQWHTSPCCQIHCAMHVSPGQHRCETGWGFEVTEKDCWETGSPNGNQCAESQGKGRKEKKPQAPQAPRRRGQGKMKKL